MQNTVNNLFAPFTLTPTHCLYFYYVSILSFILLITNVLAGILLFFKNKIKKNNNKILLDTFIVSLSLFIPYYINRLMYTMCINSVK